MERFQIGWFLQTWMLSAQVFSTREFSQLAVYRLVPRLAPLFTIVILPLGMTLDGTILHFHVSAGVMGVLYITMYLLRFKRWEQWAFALTITASFLGMRISELGNVPGAWSSSMALALLIAVLGAVLKRFQSAFGITVASVMCVLVELILTLSGSSNMGNMAVLVMTAIMSGLYVNFRVLHDKQVREAHKALQYDVLTGALTRRGLTAWLEECVRTGRNEGVIVFCDLDNFKWINDTWGHEVGDRVLQHFVKRIREGLREGDTIARFGGDEYQIWIPLDDAYAATDIVNRLHHLATEGIYPVLKDGDEQSGLKIGVSMGWTFGKFTETNANAADFAVLSAKKSGKNRITKSSECAQIEETNSPESLNPHLYWLMNITNSLWSEASHPFVLTDAVGRILVANGAYEDLVGRKFDELQGEKPGVNSANKTPTKVYKNMWDHLASGKPWSGFLLNRRSDGSEWWEISELFPVKLSGQTLGYWGMVSELTDSIPSSSPTQDLSWDVDIEWVFQPIVETHSRAVLGYEALARPKWGLEPLSPDTFFKMAKRFNRSQAADWKCLESLLSHLQRVQWPSQTRLFLNVYTSTLLDETRLRNWLQRFYKQHPDVICVFEILERQVESFDAQVWFDLQQEFPLIELAQDDFGVGEQDLLRLAAIKPTWLKLDKEWHRLLTEPEVRDLLYRIIDWAAVQNIRVIMEGIETPVQSRVCENLGIQFEQGFYWSRPLPSPNFEQQKVALV